MQICSLSVAIGLVSIAVLIYSAVEVSKVRPDAQGDELRRRNQFIVLLALSAVGIIFAAGRLGYVNLKRFGVPREGRMTFNPNAKPFKPAPPNPTAPSFYPRDYDFSKEKLPLHDWPVYTSMRGNEGPMKPRS